MKLNKTFGRIATTLVATAMLASVAVVPAFAEKFGEGEWADGVIDTTDSTALTQIVFTKELMKPATVNTPNKTFTFTLSNSTDVQTGATYESNGVDVNLYNGVGATDATAQAVFTASMGVGEVQSGEAVNTVSTTVTFNVPQTGFSDTGVYKYDITENQESAPYYNGSDLDLYLFVERIDNSYRVTGAVLTEDGNVSAKTDSTTNGYMVDPDDPNPTPDTNDLVITKTVNGTMGNYSEKFNFTVSLPGDSEDKYNAVYTYADDSTANVKLNGGPNQNIQLANDESLTIYGLVTGDSYTVTEDDYAGKGYTTTIEGEAVRTLTENYNSSDKDISVVNTREAVSPTGLVMDIAPYALLVVVAAAGCFVFLRKRRED